MKISNRNANLLVIAHSFLNKNNVLIAGLLGASIFESIIEDFESKLNAPFLKINYGVRIENLADEAIIDEKIKLGLEKAWDIRNAIIHPTLKKSSYCHESELCGNFLINTLIDTFNIDVKVDYEEKAKAEDSQFPDSWLGVGGMLPTELTDKHFSNLIYAAENYMAPLGNHLTKECLSTLDPSLKFQTLSRVNYTSGYVWLSAVKSNINSVNYRSRVALPGLTVVLKPTGINVYVELPGKAINYKKVYYEKILQFSNLTNLLRKCPMLKKGDYEFFHTWWFADREFVGTVTKYLSCSNSAQNLKKLRKEWRFNELASERLHEIETNLVPITRNSFLIGRFYTREDCLHKYSSNLPELIAQDFRVLHPILQDIYERTLNYNVL